MDEDDEVEARLEREPGLAQEWIRQNNLMYGGLIGIGIVLVQPYVGQGPLPILGLVTVTAFAVSIPMLAALMLLSRQEEYRNRVNRSAFVEGMRSFALLAAMAGVVTAFWQMSWIAGVAVLVGGVAAVAVHGVGYQRVESRRATDAVPPASDPEL